MLLFKKNDKILIVLLGNKNNQNEKLSQVAEDRCNTLVKFFTKYKSREISILLTGGFGEHFNQSKVPHHEILKQYLIKQGIPADVFIPPENTCGTYEDLEMVSKKMGPYHRIVIVTSEYHIPRVKLIVSRVIKEKKKIKYIKVNSMSKDSIEDKMLEPIKLSKLREDIIKISDKKDFDKEVYNNASAEHKHYDTLSLAIVSGALIMAGFSLTLKLDNPYIYWGFGFVILMFWWLYCKLADFAKTAREVMYNFEINSVKPGFSYHAKYYSLTFNKYNLIPSCVLM